MACQQMADTSCDRLPVEYSAGARHCCDAPNIMLMSDTFCGSSQTPPSHLRVREAIVS